MRSEQFKNRPSQIRGTKEKTTPRNRSWDRVIYMVILGLLVLVVMYLLLSTYFFVSGEGRIVGTHLEVRFPSDVKVTEVFVEQGQEVSPQDSLFRFTSIEKNRTTRQIQEDREEREEEIMEIQSDIELLYTERTELRDKIAFYEDQKALLEKEVKLDIEPVNKLHNVNSKLVDLNSDLNILQKELSLKHTKANRMQQKLQTISRSFVSEEMLFTEAPGTVQTYFAPKSGYVAQIFKETSEFAFRSEPVMSIRIQRPQVRIKAIFKEQNVKHLSSGDEVTVTFDNGEKSKGEIIELQDANQSVINRTDVTELSDRYFVEIKPVDKEGRKLWESLSHMGVTVTKNIYSL